MMKESVFTMTLNKLNNNDNRIIMSDFKIPNHEREANEFDRIYGLCIRNSKGEMINIFVTENKHISQTTNRRLYTWKSPAVKLDHIKKDQMILC